MSDRADLQGGTSETVAAVILRLSAVLYAFDTMRRFIDTVFQSSASGTDTPPDPVVLAATGVLQFSIAILIFAGATPLARMITTHNDASAVERALPRRWLQLGATLIGALIASVSISSGLYMLAQVGPPFWDGATLYAPQLLASLPGISLILWGTKT